MMDLSGFTLEKITHAGQGCVYRGEVKEDYFSKEVIHRYAIKVFYHMDAAEDERKNMECIDNFTHVIAPRGCGILNGSRFIAYELADTTLESLILNKPTWCELEVTMIIGQILIGLEEVHRHDLLHLDVKPSNILMVNHKAKVADLGLAVKCPGKFVRLNYIAGTNGFLASEAKRRVNLAASDFYSLGKLILTFLVKRGDDWYFRSNIGDYIMVSVAFKDFVKRLLEYNYTLRLGYRSYVDFWFHPLFDKIIPQNITKFTLNY